MKKNHEWEPSVYKGNPVMRCTNPMCGFIWQPHMREPKSTCDDIIASHLKTTSFKKQQQNQNLAKLRKVAATIGR